MKALAPAAGRQVLDQRHRHRRRRAVHPELSWSNFLQYDDEANEYGINSRWRWIQGPGHQVFVVFSERLDRVNHVVSPALEGVAVKVQYTLQL